jgi:hypothetical protein
MHDFGFQEYAAWNAEGYIMFEKYFSCHLQGLWEILEPFAWISQCAVLRNLRVCKTVLYEVRYW